MTQIVPYIEAPLATAKNELIALLLEDKRSECARRTYWGDLYDFFGAQDIELKARDFCSLSVSEMALQLARYKARLRERGLSKNTTNRGLATVRSLLKFAHRLERVMNSEVKPI